MKRKLIPFLVMLLFLPILPARAGEPLDLEMVNRIRDEGFNRSQVMDTAYHLTDVIGPRLTGSPQLKEANDWVQQQFKSWGLANVHLEGYPFGRGWSLSSAEVRMVSPQETPLLALPKAWSAATQGAVRGEAVRATIESEEDFEKYKGKIAGKVLFLSEARTFEDPEDPAFQRYSPEDLETLAPFEVPGESRRAERRQMAAKRWKFRRAFNEFLAQEKAVATVDASTALNGILRITGGGSFRPGESVGVPALVMVAEHYNQILRLLEKERKVELEITVASRFHDDDTQAYNILGEIPGTDLKDEIVMAGAHIDSWHTGTGATDNAAGTAVVMEAARILAALGITPRRTIRFVLWSGEEQGLYGSVQYVKQHFATRPESDDPKQQELPEYYRDDTWPLQLKPEHAQLAAYFNLDNGTGKVRGIYTEGNAAVRPIFEAWLAPLADLGATTVSSQTSGGTDHVPFDRVGLPGFQFIQDQMDYRSRTHHTNLDTYDHLKRDDLMQASVVMATFLYHAAVRHQALPRKPVPQEPAKKK